MLVTVRIICAAAALGCIAAFTFIGALHSPSPHNLDIGLVGTAEATDPVATQLEEQAPGDFDLHRYGSRSAAEEAIQNRDVAAAYVPGTPQAELLVAGANGAMQVSTVMATFDRLSGATGSELVVDDVRPTPDGDRAGLSPYLLVVSLTIPSLALAVLITVLGSKVGLRSRERLAGAVVGAIAIALVNTVVADYALGALTDHFWAVLGVSALDVFAVTSATLAVHRLLGPVGLALSLLVFMVVAMPATGAAVGPAYLPGALRAITLSLPAGEAVPALRSAVYFDGAGSAGAVWLLVAWSVAGALVLLSAPRRAGVRSAVATPVEG
jgi:hypothetical protein